MRTTRIYSDEPLTADMRHELPASAARHIVQVLRMSVGAELILFDESGMEYTGTIESATKSKVVVALGPAKQAATESKLRTCLWHGLCRSDRMDTVIQKATELGVSEIQPVITERDLVRLDARRAERKLEHWRSIAISACEQSGRTRIPLIGRPATLSTCLQNLKRQPVGPVTALLCDPDGEPGLRRHLVPGHAVVVLTGPEGGLSPAEKAEAVAAGFISISLGPRILRTETAPAVILSLIQGLLGDLQIG